MICLRITLLGGFEAVSADGEGIAVQGRKPRALLACLAIKPGTAWSRDKLADLLWSDRGDERARASLRQALSGLHKALGGLKPDPLCAGRDAVSLDGGSVESDVARFIGLAEDAGPAALEQAAALYRGELLDGLGPTDPAFDEWLASERRNLNERAQEVLGALLDHQQTSGATGQAIATARGLVAIDPLQETVHRTLMSLYVAQGDRALALKQYRACRDVLKNELEITPSPETEALRADILHLNDAPQSVLANDGKMQPRALPDKPSIAVLPFTNMSGDAEQEYFSDGITEDIITGLSRFRELFVIARNSSFTYKGRPVKVQDIGEELGVRYVVEGSVRKVGNRVRITAQLIDAATGNHLWAERYDRNMEDVLAIQDDVTETVVATLAGRLGELGFDYAKRKATHILTAFD